MDRFWTSKECNHIKYETRSSRPMEAPRPPSWNFIWRHYSAAGGPIWTKFGNVIQNSTHISAIWSTSQREEEFQFQPPHWKSFFAVFFVFLMQFGFGEWRLSYRLRYTCFLSLFLLVSDPVRKTKLPIRHVWKMATVTHAANIQMRVKLVAEIPSDVGKNNGYHC